MTFRGLTWDHPRGYDALAEAARRVNAELSEPLIHWDKQPLAGFESAPITELAANYDLVILDHPHIGEAVAERCFLPLEELFSPAELTALDTQSVGPSFASYGWGGQHWALPLDVATQVMARRPDRITRPPASWDEIEDMARKLPVAMSLGGPHAFLSLMSMAAGRGVVVEGDDLISDDVALPLLARLARLARQAPPGAAEQNPIALLERMAQSDDIALVPLVFGYVTYARPQTSRHALAFSDSLCEVGGRGGVLGGTGIAISRRCVPSDALRAHIMWLMDPATQTGFIPAHGGQPSARAAWTSAAVNAAWGNFYAMTLRTAERALLRPRFDGFPAFTNVASARLRHALSTGEDETVTLTALRSLWHTARASARGDLDEKREDP